jgi:hypothetical protein
MLSGHRVEALAEILTLTIAETEAAQARRWQEVRSMDRRRLELLDRFFAQPPEGAERDALADQLRQLVQQDAALLRVARAARDDLAERMERTRRQRVGVAAYREASA